MKNKKHFNNLFDSICMTLLLIAHLAMHLLIVWFGVVNSKEGTNPFATLIISSILYGFFEVVTITIIIKYCYEYWILLDDSITSKKLFSKKVIVKFIEIEKVEKKTVSALILGVYKSEAYVIYSKNNKIVILINGRKKFKELDIQLNKFILM